jgi:hypothetical protein
MRFRVYLKPFDDTGNYVADWIEVTSDVSADSMADLRQVLDDDTYNVGVFRFADFALKLRNEQGLYSDAGELRSIFQYKRSDALVRITWQLQDFESHPGVIIPGEFIPGNDEVEIFEGLLSDEASDTDIRDQIAQFKVRGLESVFANTEVPFADISNGDLVSEIILAILDQDRITQYLTVAALNINPSYDAAIDDVSEYETSTVKEVLDDMLLISNSILVIEDGVVIVKPRTETVAVMATFYGQASNNGIENIIDLKDIRTGVQKMFNYCTWAETTLLAREADSIAMYGIRKKEFDFSQVTNNTTRQNILNEFRDEFGLPKATLSMTVPCTEENLMLKLLDSIIVDYPTVLYAPPGEQIPVYGTAIYGDSVYPYGAWSLTIGTAGTWKIMGRNLKTKNHQIEFILRKV